MGLTRIRAEQISDIDFKQAVRVVTTADVTLSGSAPNVVDGATLIANDRVLVAGQTTGSENGIYVVTTPGTGSNGTWTRSTDANATGEIEAGMILMVTDGTIYADTQWVLATNNPIVVGTTALTFQQNITNTGNVSSGSSGIRVLANSNVLVSVSGTANIATFAVDGLYITGNITTGNLAVGNDVVITGNLTVNGTTTTINSNTITTNDKSITLANNQSTSANVDGAGIDVGNPAIATWRYSNATASWQSNVAVMPTANGTLALGGAANYWSTVFANTASLAGNVTSTGAVISTINATTISAAGNITGNYILGNGALLTSITGTNVTGTVANATFATSAGSAGTVTTAAQPNITSVGILSSVSITGNVNASQFVGNGAPLTTITGANVSGTVANATFATSAGTATTAGTVTTAAQGNITSVGTLTSLAVTGNTTSGNLLTGGQISAAGNITGVNLFGTIQTGSQLNITQVGMLSSLVVTGNVSGGNISTAGLISSTGTVTGGNLTTNGSVGIGTSSPSVKFQTVQTIADWTGDFKNYTAGAYGLRVDLSGSSGSQAALQVYTAIDNGMIVRNDGLVGIGTFSLAPSTRLTVAGAISATGAVTGAALTGTSLTVSTGNITGGNIVNGNGNGIGNIGSSTTYFNTVFAKATSAQYADLAEMYVADADYPPGTVVDFGGVEEITQTVAPGSTAIAGVISTNPSYIMNSGQQGKHVLPVALTGRVPCRVQGPVSKGDVLVSSTRPGVAQRIGTQYQPGCVIGKSLGYIDDASIQTIEVVVGRF
jgi:hypothetical protein